jgi:hypothetical protein
MRRVDPQQGRDLEAGLNPSEDLIAFPAHALLILEERLREQEAEGVQMPEGMERDDLSLRILIAAATLRADR